MKAGGCIAGGCGAPCATMSSLLNHRTSSSPFSLAGECMEYDVSTEATTHFRAGGPLAGGVTVTNTWFCPSCAQLSLADSAESAPAAAMVGRVQQV